ncbi:MAG: transposase [Anaerolineae bacterium]|nr:transposase [Anaerolineae bacterium]
MENQKSTKENINKLIEFRQAVYEKGMPARRDALFNIVDALLCEGSVTSFAMLSQSEQFQRKWPSLYAGVADGKIDSAWLRKYLAQQVPLQGVCVFPIDGSPWPRPRSRVLEDRQYIYQASSDVNGGTVTVGYPYSLLEWCVEPHTSWSLPIDVRRVPAAQTTQAIGAEQIHTLAQSRQTCLEALDIVAADGKYGNSGFLRTVKGLRCGILVRLRCDRVLHAAPLPPQPHQKGRPRIHGARFAFKEPKTWGTPTEVIELQDAYWGQVRLERWHGLHEKKGADVPYEVIRACVHLEREKPPAALWLAWLAPLHVPVGMSLTVETLWRAYSSRWPVEAGIHFRKETLGWTRPRFQSKEAGDRWTELTALVCWMLFLARAIVTDSPLPWQKAQPQLTPQRVQQSLRPIFALIGSPARSPKTRGKSPGWPRGRRRTPKPRYAVVKKTSTEAKTA